MENFNIKRDKRTYLAILTHLGRDGLLDDAKQMVQGQFEIFFKKKPCVLNFEF
jgi:hypothetical protein